MTKRRYRKTLEERHNDPKRVFSFQFSQDNERQQQARKWLENVESDYAQQTVDDNASLAEIFTDIILDYMYDRPRPTMTEKRIADITMKRLQSIEEMLQDIYERDPVIVQGAIQSRKDSGQDIDEDFIGGMFDDFENTGDR